jgi:hypothetical protein
MRKKKVYTKEIHIDRLTRMLKRKKPCDCCPASKNYLGGPWNELWANAPDREICNICRGFVGLSAYGYQCPCHSLGQEEALRRTYLALEKEREQCGM